MQTSFVGGTEGITGTGTSRFCFIVLYTLRHLYVYRIVERERQTGRKVTSPIRRVKADLFIVLLSRVS